jgi:hypothetical protein
MDGLQRKRRRSNFHKARAVRGESFPADDRLAGEPKKENWERKDAARESAFLTASLSDEEL